jgi:HD superfamily phosphohydrolase
MQPQHYKIFNDPVYGFVSVPYGILLEIIDHPYFQRLRRIRQLGLSPYVYPGALHTRFHHALGALHLMQSAIASLRGKGVDISDVEAEAVSIAILLHDIGHGPFSHALEHTLVDMHHETLSTLIMERLNTAFSGRLTHAIQIFRKAYTKPFLHQLVSGQLDMDRMDYLNRDSFFTGVHEGVIGYDRIIKMLAVHNGNLVVEEKGVYSLEKFLLARRLMYWQVYLHKTGVAAEQMLIHTLKRARQLALQGVHLEAPNDLRKLLYHPPGQPLAEEEILSLFLRLDDTDITAAVKYWTEAPDPILAFLSSGLLHRKLFRLEWYNTPIDPVYLQTIGDQIASEYAPDHVPYLLYTGSASNRAYDEDTDPIYILFKNATIKPLSACSDVPLHTSVVTKYFVCYPKSLLKA